MHWIFKNKDFGKIAATASIGLITLWDIEGGLPQIDKYQYSKDPYVVGGAALAVGLTCTRVSHENDPAFALLFEPCENKDPNIQLPAIMGMGLAYADSNKVQGFSLNTLYKAFNALSHAEATPKVASDKICSSTRLVAKLILPAEGSYSFQSASLKSLRAGI